MKNNEKSKENTLQALVEPERARRANGGSTNAPAGNCVPNPEVSEKASRRKFTAQYKIRIVIASGSEAILHLFLTTDCFFPDVYSPLFMKKP
ncbi:MAG: hypothetical protein ACUBOA_01880 [Candidatus Loosdrechtia sp.]|uniref:hypothetical protein n=1 Tax=Candidatus Loosdrechtia sp. TaxID=3101272 RepID=UPI003A6B7DF0|nr:MAG: hypothetical protein QY305_12900 [Candidatus Jettenia sp. AMX2]